MTYSAQTRLLSIDPERPDRATIDEAAHVLRGGGLVAFPTETVYGLGANATDFEAVARIFAAKGRPANDPIIVHIADAGALLNVAADIPEKANELAQRFWPGPLTLVLMRGKRIPASVSAGLATVAVRMPAHPVARALIDAAGVPIAAPSANRFSRPSATTAAHVLEDLDGRVDIILDGGATPIGIESTVLDLTSTPPRVLRPGGVPLEALRALLPDVTLRSQMIADDEAATSPGQLLRHYSPRAELRLYDGEANAVLATMLRDAADLLNQGKHVGVLLADEERAAFAALRVEVVTLGARDDLNRVALSLFAALRDLDARGVEVILTHGFAHEGLGAAIWDRLVRAAEGRIIHVR